MSSWEKYDLEKKEDGSTYSEEIEELLKRIGFISNSQEFPE